MVAKLLSHASNQATHLNREIHIHLIASYNNGDIYITSSSSEMLFKKNILEQSQVSWWSHFFFLVVVEEISLYNLCICFKPKTKGCYLHMKKWSVSWVVSFVGDFIFFPCSLLRRCSCCSLLLFRCQEIELLVCAYE